MVVYWLISSSAMWRCVAGNLVPGERNLWSYPWRWNRFVTSKGGEPCTKRHGVISQIYWYRKQYTSISKNLRLVKVYCHCVMQRCVLFGAPKSFCSAGGSPLPNSLIQFRGKITISWRIFVAGNSETCFGPSCIFYGCNNIWISWVDFRETSL